MRSGTRLLAAVLMVPLLAAARAADAQIVQDGSFETPVVSNANPALRYQYNPAGGPWTFSGGAGLINGTTTDFHTPAPFPDGQQVAFLQSGPQVTALSRIAQTLTLPTTGSYQLTFQAAGRRSGGFHGNTIFDVLLGGTEIGTGTTSTDQPFGMRTVNFNAAAGTYEFAFAFDPSQPTTDNTAFFDAVQIVAVNTTVPEPGTWALLGTGLLLVGAMAARRRQSAM